MYNFLKSVIISVLAMTNSHVSLDQGLQLAALWFPKAVADRSCEERKHDYGCWCQAASEPADLLAFSSTTV